MCSPFLFEEISDWLTWSLAFFVLHISFRQDALALAMRSSTFEHPGECRLHPIGPNEVIFGCRMQRSNARIQVYQIGK